MFESKTLPVITSVKPALRIGPWCEARVKLTNPILAISRRRLAKTNLRKMDPDQCAELAFYIFNGVHVCKHHAGILALYHLTQEPIPKPYRYTDRM